VQDPIRNLEGIMHGDSRRQLSVEKERRDGRSEKYAAKTLLERMSFRPWHSATSQRRGMETS
jgi:hypothetical protein